MLNTKNQQNSKRICNNPDCNELGIYPAPKSRNNLREYYYFCIDCIRDFNKSWNYFAGLVLHESKTIPEPGQEFRFFDIRIRILQKRGNFIAQLRLWNEANIHKKRNTMLHVSIHNSIINKIKIEIQC